MNENYIALLFGINNFKAKNIQASKITVFDSSNLNLRKSFIYTHKISFVEWGHIVFY